MDYSKITFFVLSFLFVYYVANIIYDLYIKKSNIIGTATANEFDVLIQENEPVQDATKFGFDEVTEKPLIDNAYEVNQEKKKRPLINEVDLIQEMALSIDEYVNKINL